MSEPLVTILDDEPQIRTMLSEALTEAGFRTAAFARATEFEAALKRQTPDVCLVDLGLPDRDGLALVHRLALESGAAIIIISGRAQVQDRVTGLELGADDYIIKPFDPAEVVARIRARLRVVPPRPEAQETAVFNGWTAHFDRYLLVFGDGTEVALSHAEGEVLRLFLRKPQAPDLPQPDAGEPRRRGGRKLRPGDGCTHLAAPHQAGRGPQEPALIKTIYGAGYIFLGDVTWR
jgi:two-component system OmpR family response regulator